MRWLIFLLFVAALPADEITLLKTFRGEFIEVAPGTGKYPDRFQFGCPDSEAAKRRVVKLEQKFAIAKYEVPQNLWQAVMGSNPSRWKGPRNSVEMVSQEEAKTFCQKITQQMRKAKLIEPDQVVRLPTEVEWEYVARAGTTTKYSFGDDPSKLNEYAWSTHNAAGNDPPVGAKKPNPWGLYDIHGYLWEWCASSPSNRGDETKTAVLRSGSWKDRAEQLRSCSRRVIDRKTQDDAIGFRCVLSKVDRDSKP